MHFDRIWCKKILVFALMTLIFVSSVTQASAANKNFTDVSQRYLDSVNYLTANELSKGITETQFGVSNKIKRGDAAIILTKALGLAIEEAPASGFTDVPARGVKAINALKQAGVVNGKSATNFGFNDLLKRGEIALMLAKSSAYDLQGSVENLPFTDVNSRYQEAIGALVEYKITSGKSESRFGTQDDITRGEYAIFIHRAEMIDKYIPIETGVAVNKVWDFPFDGKLDQSTVTKANIRVVDSKGKDVPVLITQKNNGATLVVSPPPGNYQKGESYELYISSKVALATGKAIEKPIRFDFIIERDNVEKGTINPEIIMVDQDYMEKQSENAMVINKSLEEKLAVEDIVVVPSAEFPEGQAYKITSLKQDARSYTITVEQPDFTELFEELDIYKTFEIKPEHIEIEEQMKGVVLADPKTARTAAANGNYAVNFKNGGLNFLFEDVAIGGGGDAVLNGVLTVGKPEFELDMKLTPLGEIKRYQVIYNNTTSLDMDVIFPELKADGEKTVYDKEMKKKLAKKKEKVEIAKVKVPTQVPGLYIQGQFFLEVKYDFSYQPEISVVFQVDESKGVIYDGKKVSLVNKVTPNLDISYQGSGMLNASSGAVANIGVTAYGIIGVGVEGFVGAKGSLEFFNGLNKQWGAYACYNAGFSPVIEGRIAADLLGDQVFSKMLVEKKFPPHIKDDNCNVFQELKSVKEVKLESGKSKELAIESLFVNLGNSETELKPFKNFQELKVESSDKNIVQAIKEKGAIILKAGDKPAKGKAIITISYTEKVGLYEKPVTSTLKIPVVISDFEKLDLKGEWSRSTLYDDALLNISNVTNGSFDFEIITQRSFGTDDNDMEGTAKISGNTAVFKEGKGIEGCEIGFQLAEKSIEIESDCVSYTGNSITFDGVFEKGPLSSIGIDPADKEYFQVASVIADQYWATILKIVSEKNYHTQNPADPKVVKTYFSPIITKTYLEKHVSWLADIVSCECGGFPIPTVDKTMLRVEVKKTGDHTFTLTGLYILSDFATYGPELHKYEFKKENGQWKLNDWDFEQVKTKDANFNLSEKEVLRTYSTDYYMNFKSIKEYTLSNGQSAYRLTDTNGDILNVNKRTGKPID